MAADFPLQQNQARIENQRQVHDDVGHHAGPVLHNFLGARIPGDREIEDPQCVHLLVVFGCILAGLLS